jgi:hypothetical protein
VVVPKTETLRMLDAMVLVRRLAGLVYEPLANGRRGMPPLGGTKVMEME